MHKHSFALVKMTTQKLLHFGIVHCLKCRYNFHMEILSQLKL